MSALGKYFAEKKHEIPLWRVHVWAVFLKLARKIFALFLLQKMNELSFRYPRLNDMIDISLPRTP